MTARVISAEKKDLPVHGRQRVETGTQRRAWWNLIDRVAF